MKETIRSQSRNPMSKIHLESSDRVNWYGILFTNYIANGSPKNLQAIFANFFFRYQYLKKSKLSIRVSECHSSKPFISLVFNGNGLM